MLNEEEEANISMFMRVYEFLRNNKAVFENDEEFVNALEEVRVAINKIFELLSEEDKDRLLERYKEEMEYLNGLK